MLDFYTMFNLFLKSICIVEEYKLYIHFVSCYKIKFKRILFFVKIKYSKYEKERKI